MSYVSLTPQYLHLSLTLSPLSLSFYLRPVSCCPHTSEDCMPDYDCWRLFQCLGQCETPAPSFSRTTITIYALTHNRSSCGEPRGTAFFVCVCVCTSNLPNAPRQVLLPARANGTGRRFGSRFIYTHQQHICRGVCVCVQRMHASQARVINLQTFCTR